LQGWTNFHFHLWHMQLLCPTICIKTITPSLVHTICSSCYTHMYNFKQNPNNVTWHLVWIDEIYNQCKCVKSERRYPQVERSNHYNRPILNRNNTLFHVFHHHKRNAILHKMFLIWNQNMMILLQNQMLELVVF
jgi:hypothetical protein